MSALLDKCKEWFNNPDNVKKWIDSIKKAEVRKKHNIERLASLSEKDRSNFINKCINKYESNKYRTKEYKKGYEPRCPLYDVILNYAEIYGEDINEDEDFLAERYKIDNKWIVELYIGQGSFIRIYEDISTIHTRE